MSRLILDANLLVLLVVGEVDRREIAVQKRLRSYGPEDYDLLTEIVRKFRTILTFPNVLTEASNLLRQCPDHKKPAFGRALAAFARGATESYQVSREAVRHPHYVRLGLTDAVLLRALAPADHLLTADLDIYLAALQAGLKAENYWHLREAYLD